MMIEEEEEKDVEIKTFFLIQLPCRSNQGSMDESVRNSDAFIYSHRQSFVDMLDFAPFAPFAPFNS